MVMKSERPVLLEFGAEYCAPCRVLAPIMRRIADEREDVMVGVVDVEDSPSLAARLGVMSVPTVIALSTGKVTGRASGKIAYEQVLNLIDNQ
jgi:thioredoxin 1